MNKAARETFKRLAEYFPEQIQTSAGKKVMELLADLEETDVEIERMRTALSQIAASSYADVRVVKIALEGLGQIVDEERSGG